MSTATSPDGTMLGYERTGDGPALILVDGGMCYRGAGPMRPLAAQLSDAFTVYTYDRRGRGESTDTLPYTVEREIEDLGVLIEQAGGRAYVCGFSSGAALCLATAVSQPGITKLALYEPPFTSEVDDPTVAKEYSERLREVLDDGRRGDAVALFMAHVGLPAEMIEGMRAAPHWATMEAIAPTLAYDDAVLAGGAVPRERAARITVPTLVLDGGASPDRLRLAARAAAEAIPGAQYRTLEGQTHDVDPQTLAPVLNEFFLG